MNKNILTTIIETCKENNTTMEDIFLQYIKNEKLNPTRKSLTEYEKDLRDCKYFLWEILLILKDNGQIQTIQRIKDICSILLEGFKNVL